MKSCIHEDRSEFGLPMSRVLVPQNLAYLLNSFLDFTHVGMVPRWVFNISQTKEKIPERNNALPSEVALPHLVPFDPKKEGNRLREPQGGADISFLILPAFDSFTGCLLSALSEPELFC